MIISVISLIHGLILFLFFFFFQILPGIKALRLIQKVPFLNFFFFFFLGPHLWHMEVPRLGVESELQSLAYTTATAMPDP